MYKPPVRGARSRRANETNASHSMRTLWLEAAAIELLLALRAPHFLLPAALLKLGARRFARFVQLRRLNNRAGARQDVALRELLERACRVPVVPNRLAQRLSRDKGGRAGSQFAGDRRGEEIGAAKRHGARGASSTIGRSIVSG